MRYLLDTCAVVWIAAEPEKLPGTTLSLVSDPDAEILISSVSAAEIACAYERRRLVLDRHWKTWFVSPAPREAPLPWDAKQQPKGITIEDKPRICRAGVTRGSDG